MTGEKGVLKPEQIEQRAIVRGGWGFLGEWWCVPRDITEDEIQVLCDKAHHGLGCHVPRELIRDRLFGFYECLDSNARAHVYFSSGSYTFLEPQNNISLSRRDRLQLWEELVKANGKPQSSPFNDYEG